VVTLEEPAVDTRAEWRRWLLDQAVEAARANGTWTGALTSLHIRTLRRDPLVQALAARRVFPAAISASLP